MIEVKKKKMKKKHKKKKKYQQSTIKYENTRIYLISFLDLKNLMGKTIIRKFTNKK
jgi:hypothetical protein